MGVKALLVGGPSNPCLLLTMARRYYGGYGGSLATPSNCGDILRDTTTNRATKVGKIRSTDPLTGIAACTGPG